MRDDVGWKLGDVVFVMSVLCLSTFLFPALLYSVFKNVLRHNAAAAMWLMGSFFELLCPLVWVERKYGIGKDEFGIRKGKWSLKFSLLIGLLSSSLVIVLRWAVHALIGEMNPTIDQCSLVHIFTNALTKPSIMCINAYFLAPIAEEVFIRGFLYGYLRSKVGFKWGLLIQAAIFSFLHWGYLGITAYLKIEYFLMGLLFGVLYEVSDSLYPGILCHSIVNYVGIALSHV